MLDDVRSPLPDAPRDDSGLHIDSMLIEEFRYASQTATQALNDRNRVVEQYLLVGGAATVGAIAAVYQLSQVGDQGIIPLVLLGFFLAVGLLGVLAFIALIRLRQASRQSLIAMNAIKEYYIQHFQRDMPSVGYAFRWRLRAIPSGERAGSITFLYSYAVAFLSALSFAAAAIVSYQLAQTISAGRTDFLSVVPILVIGGVTFLVFLIWFNNSYRHALSPKIEQRILDDASRGLDKDQ